MVTILAARPTEFGEAGWVGRWSPGIGDPTFMGWVTVVCYFVAAWSCYRVLQRMRRVRDSSLVERERWLWRGLTAILVALGINKQLDLQTAMTEGLRMLSREQGWYHERRLYQVAFIEMMVLFAVVGGVGLVIFTWKLSRAVKIAGMGLCFLGAFVLIRATSFHNMDALIRKQVMALSLNWILELGGIGVVIAGALSAYKRLRPAPRR